MTVGRGNGRGGGSGDMGAGKFWRLRWRRSGRRRSAYC